MATDAAAPDASEPPIDVIVVGAGPTGENVAGRAVAGGLTALVVEAELVGGECSYWACMPSKALLRPVHALRAAQRVAGAAEAATGTLDVPAVLARRDSFVSGMDDASQVLKVGQEIEAKIIGNDRKGRTMQLSIKAKDEAEVQETLSEYNRQASEASSGTTKLGALLREQLGNKGE